MNKEKLQSLTSTKQAKKSLMSKLKAAGESPKRGKNSIAARSIAAVNAILWKQMIFVYFL